MRRILHFRQEKVPAAQVEQTVRPLDEVYCPAPHAVWPVAAEAELAMYPAAAAEH